MAVEIETKIQVPSHADVRERLKQLGAQHVENVLQTDTFFDSEDRSLLAADRGLRLRRLHVADSKSPDYFIVTYKGPRKHGALKSREEVEVTVGTDHDAVRLFESLGFMRVLTFQKRRESWKLADCKVELDELPHLGYFVEIEGPREESIIAVRDQLQLSSRPHVRASYIAMLATHLQENGISNKVVVFDK
jgi:adenylate cyclase, class 2